MLIPSVNKLSTLVIVPEKPPTLLDLYPNTEITIKMNDGTVGVYTNEGSIELYGKFNSLNHFYEIEGLKTEEEKPIFNQHLTNELKRFYPNITMVFLIYL